MTNSDIDFVILWVDSNDLEWQKEKSKYMPGTNDDVKNIRYQNWDNLKYWFRTVAFNTPWVKKIHLVTCGQVPKWLNVNNPKIHLVKHSDYMPEDCLPVFNSSAIEIGIYKIPDLADKFVFFNDDMFITNSISENYFFNKGIPVDMPGFTRTPKIVEGNVFSSLLMNNSRIIQRHFNKKDIIKKRLTWWFNPLYGKTFIRTFLAYMENAYPGFVMPHLSTPYLKSDFEKVWSEESEALLKTQYNRFRSNSDLSHFLIRNWRMCEGNFIPRKSKGKYFSIDGVNSAQKAAKAILNNTYPEICINETCTGETFEQVKEIVNTAFAKKYPKKCEFEI